MSGLDCPRIAWLIRGDEQWGVAQAVQGLAAAVRQRGVMPVMLALSDGPFAGKCRQSGLIVKTLGLPLPPSLTGNILKKIRLTMKLSAFSRKAAPTVAAAVQECQADWLHFIWPNLIDVAGRAAVQAAIPCTWEMPVVLGKYPFAINRRIRQRQLAKYGITPLANSQFTASRLGDKPVKPIVMYLGVDPERFNPKVVKFRSRQEFGIAEDAIVLGMVARLRPAKGQLQVIQAVGALGKEYSNVHLILAGGTLSGADDAYLMEIKKIAAANHFTQRLHLVGEVERPETLYGIIDIPINALLGAESFGLSVVEAMMMERPILVHAAGGPKETVIDGKTGWHIPEVTSESMQAGLKRAIADRPRWNQMRQAARAHALSHFTIDRQADLFVGLVRKRLATAHRP